MELLAQLLNECTPAEYHGRPAHASVIPERIYCADLWPGFAVRINARLLSGWAGQRGIVAYVGVDRVEVAIGEAVISFLPEEVEVVA